jgi:hypothetical protein
VWSENLKIVFLLACTLQVTLIGRRKRALKPRAIDRQHKTDAEVAALRNNIRRGCLFGTKA